jgi:hypothetical protein
MQALLVGWLTQSVMALLYDRLVKPARLVAVVWACLNVGLALTILGQPVLAFTGNDWVGGLVAMGGLMQAAGGIMFAAEVVWAMRTRRKQDTR